MSTVLARMAERARRPLSPVEPLTPSRFAAVPPSGSAAPDDGSLTWQPDPSPAGSSARRAAPDRDTEESPAGIPATLVEVARTPMAAVSPRRPGPRAASAPVTPAATGAAAGRREQGSGSESVAAVASRSAPGAPSRQASAVRPDPAAPQVPEAEGGAAAEPIGGFDVPAEPAAGPAEITITIGHIEVRTAPAPQQSPQRVRAQFRPRVRLEDFLGQGGDGRR